MSSWLKRKICQNRFASDKQIRINWLRRGQSWERWTPSRLWFATGFCDGRNDLFYAGPERDMVDGLVSVYQPCNPVDRSSSLLGLGHHACWWLQTHFINLKTRLSGISILPNSEKQALHLPTVCDPGFNQRTHLSLRFFLTVWLRYNSHTIQSTHIKYNLIVFS